MRLIGYYDHAPYACLVTELCERGTLATFASRNRALCRALARRFTLELGLLQKLSTMHIINITITKNTHRKRRVHHPPLWLPAP